MLLPARIFVVEFVLDIIRPSWIRHSSRYSANSTKSSRRICHTTNLSYEFVTRTNTRGIRPHGIRIAEQNCGEGGGRSTAQQKEIEE